MTSATNNFLRRLPQPLAERIPHDLLAARLGTGTVASQLDRAIRVRVEGDGPPSQRNLIPETSSAEQLLSSHHGPAFERLVRAGLQTLDAHSGVTKISTLTLLPDEHAARAVDVLHAVLYNIEKGFDYEAWLAADPANRAQVASSYVREVTAGTKPLVQFSSGLHTGGHVMLMPSQSRVILASLGMYRIQPSDQVTALRRNQRVWYATDAYRTLVHELQHTVSPALEAHAPAEHLRVLEEATSTLLEGWLWHGVSRRAGADLQRVARAPRTGAVPGGVAWDAWNNGRLPDAPKDLVASRKARYVGGPQLLRTVFAEAGMDLRTSKDRQRAVEVLQGGPVEGLADRLGELLASSGWHPSGPRLSATERAKRAAQLVRDIADGRASLKALTPSYAK